jgi:hypothetical protein
MIFDLLWCVPVGLVACSDVDWIWGISNKGSPCIVECKNLLKAEYIIRFVPFAQALSILCSCIYISFSSSLQYNSCQPQTDLDH